MSYTLVFISQGKSVIATFTDKSEVLKTPTHKFWYPQMHELWILHFFSLGNYTYGKNCSKHKKKHEPPITHSSVETKKIISWGLGVTLYICEYSLGLQLPGELYIYFFYKLYNIVCLSCHRERCKFIIIIILQTNLRTDRLTHARLQGVEASHAHLPEPIPPLRGQHTIVMDGPRHIAEGFTVLQKLVVGVVNGEAPVCDFTYWLKGR